MRRMLGAAEVLSLALAGPTLAQDMGLLPVDKNGRDMQNVLIDRGQTQAISIPGIQSAQAAPPSQAQAVENGQTCPPCLID